MRIRKDVKEGDVVWRNKRGWYVPFVEESTSGKILKVYQNGEIRDLTSLEWTDLGFGVQPVTKQAVTEPVHVTKMRQDTLRNQAIAIFLGILVALTGLGLIIYMGSL